MRFPGFFIHNIEGWYYLCIDHGLPKSEKSSIYFKIYFENPFGEAGADTKKTHIKQVKNEQKHNTE